jgi:hypothetical protein
MGFNKPPKSVSSLLSLRGRLLENEMLDTVAMAQQSRALHALWQR